MTLHDLYDFFWMAVAFALYGVFPTREIVRFTPDLLTISRIP